jgi:hypothetical protein
MGRPEQAIHLPVADRLRWRAAPGVFAGATVATATGLDVALAQLRAWGLLLPDAIRLPYAEVA